MHALPPELLRSTGLGTGSPCGGVNRFDNGQDVTVLENQASPFTCFPDDDIHHRPGQVVRSNHLVGKQHPKRGVDPAQQAISEIRSFRVSTG